MKPEPPKRLEVAVEHWPIDGAFTISRGSKREAIVVVASVLQDSVAGRGECVPYARYGESVASVAQMIEGCREALARGTTRADLQALLPAGAARNALDCAFWDLEAKRAGVRAWDLAGLTAPAPVDTAYTISLAAPDEMAGKAASASHYGLLKLKLGGDGDEARMAAVRAARPEARLIADANEAWREEDLNRLLAAAAEARIELIEQPLPAHADEALARVPHRVPICADESVHDRASLTALVSRYDAVNIKLDKTGGLTEALATAREAKTLGFKIMLGCMVATSLAMAPALLLAHFADWVDLDGPLLLARDRKPGLTYDAGLLMPPPSSLWG